MRIKGKRVLKNGALAGYVKQKDGSWKWRIIKGPKKKRGGHMQSNLFEMNELIRQVPDIYQIRQKSKGYGRSEHLINKSPKGITEWLKKLYTKSKEELGKSHVTGKLRESYEKICKQAKMMIQKNANKQKKMNVANTANLDARNRHLVEQSSNTLPQINSRYKKQFDKLLDVNRIFGVNIGQDSHQILKLIVYNTNTIEGSPFSRIGDAEFIYINDNDLGETIIKMQQYFTYSIDKIFNRILDIEMNQEGRVIQVKYIPPIKNLVFINSKIDYLKILSGELIDNGTILIDAPKNINIKEVIEAKKAHTTYLQSLKGVAESPDNACVIKFPFSGGSSCVVRVENIKANEKKSYEYWLGLFINKSEEKNRIRRQRLKIKCSGFSIGMIIQRFNTNLADIGEFRCFCINSVIVAIVHSQQFFRPSFGLLANRRNLFDKNDNLKVSDLGDFELNMSRIDFLKDAFRTTFNKNGLYTQNIKSIETFFTNIQAHITEFVGICENVYKICEQEQNPLTINRIDLTISNDSDFTNPRFIVNEIEDFSYGLGSTEPINNKINNTTRRSRPFKRLLAKIYLNSI